MSRIWIFSFTTILKNDTDYWNLLKRQEGLEFAWYHITVLNYLYYLESSSSSGRATSMDILDPLSPLLPIVHRFWLVLKATSHILTELLYVGSSWLPYFCSAMLRGPKENIIYELVPASPAVSCMSGSSNFDSFRDRWLVAV